MNAAFHQVIGAKDDERLELFLASARRLGTAVQNVEKDFWVCWVLDVLSNGMGGGHPRLMFRGGTSLSKSFGLITGAVPPFADVMKAIGVLEQRLNAAR